MSLLSIGMLRKISKFLKVLRLAKGVCQEMSASELPIFPTLVSFIVQLWWSWLVRF